MNEKPWPTGSECLILFSPEEDLEIRSGEIVTVGASVSIPSESPGVWDDIERLRRHGWDRLLYQEIRGWQDGSSKGMYPVAWMVPIDPPPGYVSDENVSRETLLALSEPGRRW